LRGQPHSEALFRPKKFAIRNQSLESMIDVALEKSVNRVDITGGGRHTCPFSFLAVDASPNASSVLVGPSG
jgi:hypothetical protein